MCYHLQSAGYRASGVPGFLGPVSVCALVRRIECGRRGASDRSPDAAEPGNFSNVEGVGAGVSELKIDFGPGYRVYFGRDSGRIVILLGGSAKKRQGAAISAAQAVWAEYRRRKGGKERGQWH